MTALELADLISDSKMIGDGENREIRGGFMSDIMSRAMAEGFEGMAWITQRADMNALAIAVMKGAACMIFPKGTVPEENVVRKASEEKMALLLSEETAFALAGKLYAAGLRSGEE